MAFQYILGQVGPAGHFDAGTRQIRYTKSTAHRPSAYLELPPFYRQARPLDLGQSKPTPQLYKSVKSKTTANDPAAFHPAVPTRTPLEVPSSEALLQLVPIDPFHSESSPCHTPRRQFIQFVDCSVLVFPKGVQ
ncbi:hypothetical protein Slin15195_G074530 [Septoria linicola]|uniref:Uncharacterized protein n=1 Tax=Septoria linicola TaxID=215465 RepID=A0A9Q9ELB0_9PEZI|nr:hypothetical protein Slin14017_G035650 [Septoria linicola]USW54134.1 hypothetical protein Slin15195_G074530 [Septoria linicola]